MRYRCVKEECQGAMLTREGGLLRCSNGHDVYCVAETDIPLFVSTGHHTSEYTVRDAVQIHDNAFKWVYQTFSTNEREVRGDLVSRLGLRPGMCVLVVGAGSCDDLPYIAEALHGSGSIHAQDISEQMLLTGIERHGAMLKQSGLELSYSVSDVKALPFDDGVFDAAYHFGGVNAFGDIRQGFSEINRVVRPGGRIVLSDEGVAPWLLSEEYGQMMVTNNPLYASAVPLHQIPATATEVKLSWILKNCFYVIEFVAGKELISVDVDVPHVGVRGGTIRTRYHGRLEGISPDIKTQLYAEAKKRGVSRVEFLEEILARGLRNKTTDSDA